MVWIIALCAGWIGAFVLLVALTAMAARSDRPTAEHHVARAAGSPLWLPPRAERDRL
jgi:hypothetical protein